VGEKLAKTQKVGSVDRLEAFHNLIQRLVKGFESASVEYVFTGALAASFYGLPRTTTDVDVVVQIADRDLKSRLVLALQEAGLVVDEKEISKALESGYRIARFRDGKTAYTVDIMLSDGKLVKRTGTVAGVEAFFQTPEDLILAKLRMIKATVQRERALKDVEDVRAILKFTRVDVRAIKKKSKADNTLMVFEAIAGSGEHAGGEDLKRLKSGVFQ
jgi:hypothetical protein